MQVDVFGIGEGCRLGDAFGGWCAALGWRDVVPVRFRVDCGGFLPLPLWLLWGVGFFLAGGPAYDALSDAAAGAGDAGAVFVHGWYLLLFGCGYGHGHYVH